ncbi:MAG: hypothetical protein H0U76_08665 [Ktedonobacteraceae bacterium]|nr:hypothetical protein [Ktedonobacteraceae bacterium]
MTCIVGIAYDGITTIAGDSAATNGSSQQVIRADSKVFVVGECIFGCGSSFRMIQLLRYSLRLPTYSDDSDIFEYMATAFINAVRECLKQGGYAREENGREEGGKFLVGLRGTLFTVESDYQIEEAMAGYNAVGSGDDIALGALFATRNVGMGPAERLELALQAASYHNSDTRPPFVFVSTRGLHHR